MTGFMGFLQKFLRVWKLRDLRMSILFVLVMLVIARVAAHIPIPGVNIENVKLLFRSNQVLGLLNLFSGGTMSNFSVVALGVAPYITASIIFQLLGMVIPRLEAIMKEGEAGQRRIKAARGRDIGSARVSADDRRTERDRDVRV